MHLNSRKVCLAHSKSAGLQRLHTRIHAWTHASQTSWHELKFWAAVPMRNIGHWLSFAWKRRRRRKWGKDASCASSFFFFNPTAGLIFHPIFILHVSQKLRSQRNANFWLPLLSPFLSPQNVYPLFSEPSLCPFSLLISINPFTLSIHPHCPPLLFPAFPRPSSLTSPAFYLFPTRGGKLGVLPVTIPTRKDFHFNLTLWVTEEREENKTQKKCVCLPSLQLPKQTDF